MQNNWKMPLDDTIQRLIQKSTNRALCQWLHCGCSFGPICIRASFSPAVGQCKPPSPSFSFTNQSNFGRGQSHWGCCSRCTKIGVRIKLIKCWEISVSIWRKSNLYLVNIFSDINKIWKLISIVYHINLDFFMGKDSEVISIRRDSLLTKVSWLSVVYYRNSGARNCLMSEREY